MAMNWNLTPDGVLTVNEIERPKRYPWYDQREDITEIIVAEGVTTIPNSAFCYCKNVQKISLPSTLRNIDNSAFYYCSKLETVHLPQSLQAIWEKAFMGCTALREIHLPPNIWHISDDVFPVGIRFV